MLLLYHLLLIGNSLILTCTIFTLAAHEYMLWAYPPDEEVELQLKQIADWTYKDRPTPNLNEYLLVQD